MTRAILKAPFSSTTTLLVRDYDLSGTLSSGQAFRWREDRGRWLGVVKNRWVALRSIPNGIQVETAEAVSDWGWLEEYLQVEVDLRGIVATFPPDPILRQAVNACWGLRLLRQEPWECLASFILSSSKQIVQIQQIVAQLCACYGQQIPTPPGFERAFSFPPAARLAACSERDLRACKMGFRAPYLLGSAEMVASGKMKIEELFNLPVDQARTELLRLPGVGRKIADCVLLFAYGFSTAFPIDVWVARALRELYFPRRRKPMTVDQLQQFTAKHFGSCAGYAQQYLFHYMRTRPRLPA